MKQGLALRASQHLALTPQLQQSIRLLQLSTLELSAEVEQMLDENPFLDRASDEAPAEEFGLAQADTPVREADREAEFLDTVPATAPLPATSASESASASAEAGDDGAGAAEGGESGEYGATDWDGDGTWEVQPDDSEWGSDAPAKRNNLGDDEQADATELARSQESLTEFLHRQALSLRLGDEDRAALRFLIESLNEDGYLQEPIEELAASLAGDDYEARDEIVHRFTVALRLLQHLEPVGVGARNLAECMTLQLQAMLREEEDDARIAQIDAALLLCAQPTELLAKRDIKRLAAATALPEAQVRAAIALIARLEPKPGRRFIDVERNVIVPDVIVTASGRGNAIRLRVTLNSDVMPRLRVHEVYANALRAHKGEGAQALQQRLQEARWFIKNIQQRFDTILRVSNAIVERQKNFFIHGELAMRPLVLREIADELGLHESTISRVTTAKYMSTPMGTFELKYFFGSALGTDSGANASSTAVRALIRQFVAAESATKPLSDNQISDMLREQGIECARRTVAKYREAMKIAPANLRKAL